MKKLLKEFKEFINKGNALALAIGVIIGGAFSSIVNAINEKIISPLIGWILGDYDLSQSLVTVLSTEEVVNESGVKETVITNAIYWGAFIQSVLDFVLIAVILFLIVKVTSDFTNKAEKTRAKIRKRIEKRIKQGKGITEEEKQIIAQPSEPVPVVPVVSEDVLLLREIRDLLAKNKEDVE